MLVYKHLAVFASSLTLSLWKSEATANRSAHSLGRYGLV